ncbi:hypothetical protein BKA83DRAFT_25348 [Pisolithus microcarpus]|nr:hypothetical protein BKA83DRAFT_25348 [Pisolithus microcarpus]
MSAHFDAQRRSSNNNKVHRSLAARFSPTASFAVTPTTTALVQDPGKNSPSTAQSSSTSAHGNTSTTSSTTTSASAVSSTTSSATTSALATSAAPAVVTCQGSATTSTTTASATSTSTSSSGSVNVTAVVGGVAGTLAGLAVLGFLLMWLMVCFWPKNPPLWLIYSASPALAAQRNFSGPGPNFYGGYAQQSLGPGDVVQPAYGQPVMGYGESGQLARQPSSAAFLARQPSAAAGYGNSAQLARQPSNVIALNRQPSAAGYGAAPANNDYVDLDRSSVTPFQAAQYAAISRHLKDMDPHVPRTSDDLNRPPLPSPFDDQPRATAHASALAAVPRAPSPVHLGSGADAAAHTPGGPRTTEVTTDANRPVSAYTVYEEGDAYGGI